MTQERVAWWAIMVYVPTVIFGGGLLLLLRHQALACVLWLHQHAHRLKLWPRLLSLGMMIAKHVRLS